MVIPLEPFIIYTPTNSFNNDWQIRPASEQKRLCWGGIGNTWSGICSSCGIHELSRWWGGYMCYECSKEYLSRFIGLTIREDEFSKADDKLWVEFYKAGKKIEIATPVGWTKL
mgnify:FL=1